MASLGFSGEIDTAGTEAPPSQQRRRGNERSLLAERLAEMAGIVEDRVVPRLVESRRSTARIPDQAERPLAQPETEVIEHLAELAVDNGSAAKAYVQSLHDDGLSIEAIYLNLLTPAARLLGKYWETDRRHFAEVTIGVGVLQQMLHDFETTFQANARRWQPGLRVLLMPAPGEQHTFGLFMIGEFMRRAGWDAWTGPFPERNALKQLITSGEFSVVGFSASADNRLAELTDTISMVRRLAKGKSLCILVGGYIFSSRPSLVQDVGADGTADNAKEAIKLADMMIKRDIKSV